MAYRGILFDKDGTLIEADGAWVPFYRRVLMRMKNIEADLAESMMRLAGYDIATGRATSGSIMAGGTTQQLVDIWWPDHSAERRLELTREIDVAAQQDVKMVIEPITDLRNLLMTFRDRGWKVGIATNDSLISTERQVAELGIEDLLDAIIASDTVDTPKPSGDMIRKFNSLTGIAASEIVMVGDNFHDIEEARRGGAGLAVAVLSGNGWHGDLAHLADVTLKSVAELPAYLGVA
jgi:phosphoglycolate phosphatase